MDSKHFPIPVSDNRLTQPRSAEENSIINFAFFPSTFSQKPNRLIKEHRIENQRFLTWIKTKSYYFKLRVQITAYRNKKITEKEHGNQIHSQDLQPVVRTKHLAAKLYSLTPKSIESPSLPL